MQQLETEELPNNYATKYRVTPQELTEAVTRIELRHAAAANETADTLTLGEAVNQLCLDATPEELLEEVRVMRANQEAEAAARMETTVTPVAIVSAVKTRRAKWKRRFGIACIITSFAANGLLLCDNVTLSDRAARFERQIYSLSGTPSSSSQDVTYQTFQTIEDDKIFTMTAPQLASIANNSETMEWASPASTATPGSKFVWRVEKWGGKTWVFGWVKRAVTDAALKSGAFSLSNVIDLNKENEFRRVKIPIERFKSLPEPPVHQNLSGVDAQTLQIPAP